jgi:aminopeptidase N
MVGDMPSLTHDEAIARAAAIRVDAYDLDFDLTKGDRVYGSVSRITFTCLSDGVTTFLDVKPDRLDSVVLDGTALDVATLDDGRIALRDLSAGSHEIVATAEMPYTNTGQGLHRFVDPVDAKVYLYAMTFLDCAPQMFACFDQPDLKAPVTVHTTADPAWVVASNGAATQTSPGRWEFATTKPLATYFTTLVAGPYHVVTSEHDGIPRTSSRRPEPAWTGSTNCSACAIRTGSTTTRSCRSSMPARWRTPAA